MSIHSIKVENFKKFSSLELDLRCPITLIYGENSSGKTSSIRALLGLMQTFLVSNKYQVWNAQGEFVDLGLYKDYIKNHNIKEKFSISLRSSEYTPYQFNYKRGQKSKVKQKPRHETEQKFTYEHDASTNQAKLFSFTETTYGEDLADLVKISPEYGMEAISSPSVSLKVSRPRTRSYFHYNVDPKSIISMFSGEAFDSNIKENYPSSSQPLEVNLDQKFKISLRHSETKKGIGRSYFKFYQYNRAMDETGQFLSKIFYLGPLRMSPFRSYKISSHTSDVGPTGDTTPLALSYLHRRAQKDNTKNKLHQARYRNFLNWFEMLFPGYEISVEQSEDVVRLKVKTAGRVDSISDVGFGFSQVLPILVQAASMEPEETLIIEQPELHLHPKAQVAFANFLTAAARSGVKFIIETHSEHILKGLQLQISKGQLADSVQENDGVDVTPIEKTAAIGISSEDIKIYYFHKDDAVTNMKLNQWGEIEGGWPDGFFDESYKISSEIVKNKIASMGSNFKVSLKKSFLG
jgi:predicted ATPase